jgi:hypothetical protein
LLFFSERTSHCPLRRAGYLLLASSSAFYTFRSVSKPLHLKQARFI